MHETPCTQLLKMSRKPINGIWMYIEPIGLWDIEEDATVVYCNQNEPS